MNLISIFKAALTLPLLVYSCGVQTNDDPKTKKDQTNTEIEQSINERQINVVGIWKIDSIKVDNRIKENILSEHDYDAFNFRSNGFLNFEEKRKFLSSRQIGEYKVVGDSIFFLTNGQIFQSYHFHLEKKVLILEGNYYVEGNKKPVFYLSKT